MADTGPLEPAASPIPEPFLLGESKLVSPPAASDFGARPSLHSATGRLRGRATGRQWAFLHAFALEGPSRRARANLHTLALFDLGNGEYGTSTEYARPRLLRRWRDDRVSPSPGQLDLSFHGSRGDSFWRARERGEGILAPLAYLLHCVGADADGRFMQLDLELDARKPPLALGDRGDRDVRSSIGETRERGYFQSGVRFSGTLAWGDKHETVDGDCGWIARCEPRFLRSRGGFRRGRYQHELLQIQLEDGTGISACMHFHRQRENRLMPPSEATASGPKGELASTTDFRLERRSFVRDPQIVAPRHPLEGTKYFADRYRLSIPAWSLDLLSEPFVAAPAHAFPIEYWSGPTRLTGTLDGAPVSGFGFDERTRVFCRDFELVEVLRETLRHLPPEAIPADGLDGEALANLAWEVDGFIGDGDQQAAVRYLNTRVRPSIEGLAEPHRSRVRTIVDDAADALLRWWVRP